MLSTFGRGICCRVKKNEIKMNKPECFGQGKLKLNKMLMYEFHHEYMEPKYETKEKLSYMNKSNFVYKVQS